jgi:hypothetical protein
MDLVNTTALAARLDVGGSGSSGRRRGLVVAKATFRIHTDGTTSLDTQDPFPLFHPEAETLLGLLPRDDLPRNDGAFEVSLFGAAYAPGGVPVESMRVALSLGSVRKEIAVFGDRQWRGDGPGATISRPERFLRMPLTWQRAFGGTTDVLVDVDSPVEVAHPENPLGIGLDPATTAASLDEFLTCPAGYPRFERSRNLPNLEDPSAPITRWEDAPPPVCWGALPAGSALRGRSSSVLHQAHPDWVLERAPTAGERVSMVGMSPAGSIMFGMPALSVHLDYVLGDRSGSRELTPHALVLLPEEHRFYVVYRQPFQIDAPTGEQRAARLRIAKGEVK